MLVELLKRLKNVPFVNKVIIVWNNKEDIPLKMLPNIGVPIEVRHIVLGDLRGLCFHTNPPTLSFYVNFCRSIVRI